MANERIKVAGYAQKVTYDGGIEYRNFSDSLVGNQFTSDGGTTLFTAANFRITTNLDPKISKIFNTNAFGNFVSLDDLRLTHEEAIAIMESNSNVILNFDKSDLENYAYFGSLREFIRVSLESIIMNWPAAIFVSPTNEFNPFFNGSTYQSYTIDTLNGTSEFSVSSTRFVNKFNVNHTQTGEVLNSFSDSNDLRNMAVNYSSYTIKTSQGEYPVIGFTGSSESNANVYFKVSGSPFSNSATTATTVTYHIKPNSVKVEGFFNSLNVFEGNLLNRLTTPLYTSNYKYSLETEQGNVIDSEMTITWPVSDGYNIDFDSERYIDFVDRLLTIAENNDIVNTNLMSRFFVSESIHDFDTADQKVGNTLRIYGREFDEIKRYIDGISNAHVVTYDRIRNTPDSIIKNLAKVLGWDLISSITEVDLLYNNLTPSESSFDGHQRGLTPTEAEIEMWRRIILNTPWIWKSKGTRKAVEFLFKFIGSPDGLVDFNEFIYVAKNALDIDLFTQILEANGESTDLTDINIDSEGYPKVLPNTADMYFQKGGLWYRETGGENSNIDILTGNNPHIGPYDAGQEYIDQFSCLIPDFEPVTLIEETILTGSTNLFTNYDEGTFDGIFENDVILTVNTDIDFEGILLSQLSGCVNNLQIVPDFSGCSATTSWNITATLNGVNIYSGTFGTGTTIVGGVVVSGDTLQSEYITQVTNIHNYLNNNYGPLTLVSGSTGLMFVESLSICDDKSGYNGRKLIIELCLNTDYGCLGGDCEAGSLIVSGVDADTRRVQFENVFMDVVPSSACCTNLGYDFSATTGGFYCYDNLPPLPNDTNIYAYFDTTSMTFEDAQAAHSSLTAWFDSLTTLFPSYTGNLYTIPCSDERWLVNATKPWTGDMTGIDPLVWTSISNLPPSGGTDTNVIVLGFIDETYPEYHSYSVTHGFNGDVTQPTNEFRDNYELFVDTYPNYDYFKCLLYPVVRDVKGEGGELVIQILAALEGTLIPSGELPSTNVDVSVLTTQNPYIGASYPSGTPVGTLQPLKNYGFEGRYDKQSPASAVFTSQTFTDDLNEFISNG